MEMQGMMFPECWDTIEHLWNFVDSFCGALNYGQGAGAMCTLTEAEAWYYSPQWCDGPCHAE